MDHNHCKSCFQITESPVCPACGYPERGNGDIHTLPIGTVLRGRYQLGRVLGQGGFGITYLGWDQLMEKKVAVKEFYPRGMVFRDCGHSLMVNHNTESIKKSYKTSLDRFLREAKALAKFSNIPEIVNIQDFIEENGTAYIVMEYVQGMNLAEYIRHKGGTLSADEAFRILRPILEALASVHKAGIIHRDISPDNIVLHPTGGAKLLDFGAARAVENPEVDKELTHSTEAILKHGFAPMEQYHTRGGIGPWTDEYAICATIYYCLTGLIPDNAPIRVTEGKDPDWSAIPGLTAAQKMALEKGMSVRAKDRWGSLDALVQALFSPNMPQISHVEKNQRLTPSGENPPARKGKGKWILAGCAVLAVIAGIAAFMAMRPKAPADVEPADVTASSTEAAIYEETVPPVLLPDETCRASYTASDDVVVNLADTVVATAGNYQLTLGQLQIYYWQEVRNWMNQYGEYAGSLGLDISQPLDQQMCPELDGRTWQQYFLVNALNSWRTYVALCSTAEAAGYVLEEEYVQYLQTLPETMETEAAEGGFADAQELLEYNVGAGATVADYAAFLETYYWGYGYYEYFCSNITATEEEIEEMFLLHEAEYAQSGLTKDTKSVNVRHILIMPEGDYPNAWSAAESAAQAILNEWLAGDMTEESFAALATKYTHDPGSQTTGGLYTDVYEGQMVEAFDNWCFDPARQIGDYAIVETEYGFHVMYYSGGSLLWMDLVKEDVLAEKANAMVDEAVAQLPLTVYYEQIYLSVPKMFG